MISVCMATYNGEKYIKEQLVSILNQLSADDEVIISDDGSKDSTVEIVTMLNDSRVKVYYNQGIHGFTHNFENALQYSKGDIIFLADQDDIWSDDKVAVTLRALETCEFTISDCVTVGADMNILQESRFTMFNMKPGFMRHLVKSRYLGCCMAFKRSVLEAALPFPQNDFLVEHDIWLAAIGFLYFKVRLIHTPLIYYRRHGNNVSTGGFEKGYSLKVKIKKRVYRIMKLIEIAPRVMKIKRNKMK